MGAFHRISTAVLGTILMSGCGVSQTEYNRAIAEADSLRKELESVRAELEELKYGAERLFALAQKAFEEEQFDQAIQFANDLVTRHPLAPEIEKAKAIAASAEKAIKAREEEERRRREAAEREERRRREAAVANLRKKYDKVREVTWYHDRSTPEGHHSGSRVYLYMGQRDGGDPWLRFVIRYTGSDWLFIENYIFKIDGKTYTINTRYGEVERDNGYTTIWEWYDTNAGTKELEIARAIADSKEAIIRYEGRQYYHDRTITAEEKRAIRNILTAYETLKTQKL